MSKFFRKLHLWVSIPFGIVITMTCFTGAMLVFETEITALCNRWNCSWKRWSSRSTMG